VLSAFTPAYTCRYLAGSGIGKIGVVDDDVVDTSNLHRQVMHQEASVGVHKAVSAAAFVQRLNSAVDCTPYVMRHVRPCPFLFVPVGLRR
jgi:molybdopterin/thiamine biosynthesis adenylyltransferase